MLNLKHDNPYKELLCRFKHARSSNSVAHFHEVTESASNAGFVVRHCGVAYG